MAIRAGAPQAALLHGATAVLGSLIWGTACSRAVAGHESQPPTGLLGAGADTHCGGGVAGRPAKSSGGGGHSLWPRAPRAAVGRMTANRYGAAVVVQPRTHLKRVRRRRLATDVVSHGIPGAHRLRSKRSGAVGGATGPTGKKRSHGRGAQGSLGYFTPAARCSGLGVRRTFRGAHLGSGPPRGVGPVLARSRTGFRPIQNFHADACGWGLVGFPPTKLSQHIASA